MKLYFKNKNIDVDVKKLSLVGKFIGLMFKNKEYGNLLFEFNSKNNISLHSYFVFFDFLVLWIDDKNKVVDYRVVKPFKFSVKSKKKFKKIVEIPLNNRNKKIIKFFVGKQRFKYLFD